MTPHPKFAYVRSKALLKACRDIPCQWCGIEDGTVCAAHSNSSEHGKGGRIKASDLAIAALCFRCHHDLDQGSTMSWEERAEMWAAAHEQTVIALTSLGKWPKQQEPA